MISTNNKVDKYKEIIKKFLFLLFVRIHRIRDIVISRVRHFAGVYRNFSNKCRGLPGEKFFRFI